MTPQSACQRLTLHIHRCRVQLSIASCAQPALTRGFNTVADAAATHPGVNP